MVLQGLPRQALSFLSLLQGAGGLQMPPIMADEGDEAFLRRYQQQGFEGQPSSRQQVMPNTAIANPVQAAPERRRVSGWRVLDRVLGGDTISEGLDAERERERMEAMRPLAVSRAMENERIAAAMGPQALLAYRANPEAFGESLGYGYRPQVIGQGGIQSVAATGQRISAPQFSEFGNELRLNDPLTRESQVIGTRGPSYSEQAAMARVQQDAAQSDARLALDYTRLGQDEAQFQQRLGFDQSKVESRPLSATQQRQVESYYQELAALDNIDAELNRFDGMIASGALELSPAANTSGRVRNVLGLSTENSRNLAEFQSTLERIRNDSLRLNNGVQTEGDAQRAWNELVTNINDPEVVRRQLSRIRDINARARQFRSQRLSAIEGGQYSSGGQPVAAPPSGISREAALAEARRRGLIQ